MPSSCRNSHRGAGGLRWNPESSPNHPAAPTPILPQVLWRNAVERRSLFPAGSAEAAAAVFWRPAVARQIPGRHDCYSTSPRPRQKTICFTVVLQMCESSPLRAPQLCPDIADSSSNTLSEKEGAERRARLSPNTTGRSCLASCQQLNTNARSGCWIWCSYSLIRELRNTITVCSFLSYSKGNCTQTYWTLNIFQCQVFFFFWFKRSF